MARDPWDILTNAGSDPEMALLLLGPMIALVLVGTILAIFLMIRRSKEKAMMQEAVEDELKKSDLSDDSEDDF